MSHTPTPWAIEGRPNYRFVAVIRLDGGDTVATHVDDADAAFIVRACNAWDDVEALRARIAELEAK
jgi:hypothetical protein